MKKASAKIESVKGIPATIKSYSNGDGTVPSLTGTVATYLRIASSW